MKCKCSLNNQYEVVGICDIEKFSKKISKFKDKSWCQISISNNLIISDDKLSIKSVTKVFVTVQIISTKLISTPKSQQTNIEGMSLTGKLLLVEGEIIQRVLYISNNTSSDKINSFKTKIPFNTYIIVDKNSDINMDKYCVYSCIEYSSVRLINHKSLSQNSTLFLFAHLIEECKSVNPPEPDPEPQLYANEIIFNTKNKDKELARIKFNTSKNVLEAISTEHSEVSIEEVIIKFELFKSDGITKKEFGNIVGKRIANKFVNDLNSKAFEYGDIINIIYFHYPNRVKITNHPNKGKDYDPKFTWNEAFIITKKGLIPYVLLSQVLLKDSNNQLIIEFNFTKFDKTIRVISTGNNTPNLIGRENYFKIVLTKITGQKFTGIIKGNEDGRMFKGSLDIQEYSSGEIIDVFCKEPNKVEISNHPNEGKTYNLTEKLERFRITDTGLEKVEVPKEYPNKIILRNNNDEELARIKFNINTKNLEVISTGNNQDFGDTSIVILYKASTIDIFEGKIESNQNASEFVTSLNHKVYSIRDVIEIKSLIGKVEITNYPDQGDDYKSVEQKERFKITDNGLVKISIKPKINTKIMLLNSDKISSQAVLCTVKFDSIINVLRVTNRSQGVQNRYTSIKVELYSDDGITLKASGEIELNSRDISKIVALEGKSYEIGDIINVSYGNKPSKLLIAEMNPNMISDYVGRFDNNEAFIITEQGLEQYVLQKKITLGNAVVGGPNVLELYLSKFKNELKVISTGEYVNGYPITGGASYFFQATLIRENKKILHGTVGYAGNADSFKKSLDSKIYLIGDTLKIQLSYSNIAKIVDIKTGRFNRLIKNTINYKITTDGLKE